ncbi:YaiO family outer membrane beta-barrel protein [Antarcticibacterium arcticum]|nr:YaiO family outer membrane beta-barrel protein [Antarcticibacterium arcticum]
MKIFLWVCLLVGTIFSSTAQIKPAEITFARAREFAVAGDYAQSIKVLEILRDSLPQNTDYSIYLARVYGWNKDYPAAITILKPLIDSVDPPEEALHVMVNTQLWAGNYEEVIKYSNLAQLKYKNSYYQIQKARALAALNRNDEAEDTLQEVLRMEPDNKEARALKTQIFQQRTEHIALSYLNTSFSDPGFKPWHLAYLEYKRDLGKVPVLARFNYADLFEKQGSLFEVDAYPKTGKNSYLYLNAGAALNTPLFPKFRGGIEYFHSLNKHFEISIGSKYLAFEETDVVLLNAGLTYNTKNNLSLNYKPYFTQTEGDWLTSHSLALRITNPIKENFVQIDLQYGSIPFGFVTSTAFTDVTSLRLGLQYRFRLTKNILVQPVFMYEYEEYFPSMYRNRFNSQLITILRFL